MSSGFFAAANFSLTLSTRSSSTQPPDTEPTIWPSSRIATIAPTGRGAEPQVLTMVPSAARWPLLRHSSAVRSTSISTLSMRKCYRNPAAFSPCSICNGNRRAMSGGDLAHDGEAKAAAGAGSAGHAVEALQHALALRCGNPRTVILDLGEGVGAAPAGAHRDAPAALRILDRVVHEIGERLAHQERIALHRRPVELEAQVDVARERLVHPGVGLALGERLQVELGGVAARARLGAREREQLVGEARGADRRLVHLLELGAHLGGQRLRERELGMRLQAGERRAQLVRSVGEKALLVAARLRDFLEQAVQRAHQRPRLLGCAGRIDRPEIARRARLDLLREARERPEAAL